MNSHADVSSIDVVPVLAGRLADKFTSEHGDDSVQGDVGNLAIVPVAVNPRLTRYRSNPR